MVTNGPEIKVFAKDTQNFANFSNYPQFPEDFVGLRLSVTDLEFMLDNMNWQSFEQSTAVVNLLRDIAQYYSQEYVMLPYISALVGITSVLEMLLDLYVQFEQFSTSLEQKDVASDKKISKNPNIKKTTSFRQINKLLRIVLGLEDQLWAMT